jgi:hypothetical protein
MIHAGVRPVAAGVDRLKQRGLRCKCPERGGPDEWWSVVCAHWGGFLADPGWRDAMTLPAAVAFNIGYGLPARAERPRCALTIYIVSR